MIHETIVTTLDANGVPHIAPFGVREEGGHVLIAPFRPSASLDNLLLHRCAVVNLTDDVRIFAGTLTGRRNWPVRPAQKVYGVVLGSALAHRELELIEVREDALRPELLFRVVHEVQHGAFRGFNRAQAAVIELAVLVSRLHMLPMERIETEMAYLATAVEKTAGERELQAWQWLVERVENFRAEAGAGNQA
ncbi:MAG TPA: DUF447 domain-containing protein [Methylophilaceae bacterium]